MPVFYSKVEKANPQDRTQTKWYPALKSVGQARNKEVSRQLADETTINPKEAEVAIYGLTKVAKRLLLSGYTVQLEDFGSFYLTASTTGSDNEADVTAKNINNLNVRFRPAVSFKEDIQKAELKPVRV